MGQYEVLEWLENRRKTGDDAYRSYREIHRAMARDGVVAHYRSVWWSIVCLYDQGRIEAEPIGGILSRRWVFRGKVQVRGRGTELARNATTVHTSGMKKHYSTNGNVVRKPRRNTKEEKHG